MFPVARNVFGNICCFLLMKSLINFVAAFLSVPKMLYNERVESGILKYKYEAYRKVFRHSLAGI